jgi:3-dehydroquinate dehydratase-2
MQKPIYVLNGPNLNLLGEREPEKYGEGTLAHLEQLCAAAAGKLGAETVFFQSNAEHQLIDWIHEARNRAGGIVINPAGYTHTSVAIRDALATFEGPKIEVHVTNVHRREEFRHHSFVSAVVDAVICGCGLQGYAFALERIISLAADSSAEG